MTTRVKKPATRKRIDSNMSEPVPKKHSVQYHGDGSSNRLDGVYIPKALLRELTGNDSVPETCTITVSIP